MKADLHRHLGGAIRGDTVWKIIQHHAQYGIAKDYESVWRQVHFTKDEPRTFERFLTKFEILDNLVWDAYAIDIMVDQVCADIAAEGISYAEISLSLNKYCKPVSKYHGDMPGALLAISDAFDKYGTIYGIKVGLLLSLRYDSARQSQLSAADIVDTSLASKLIGMDFVGDEAYFDQDFYRPIIARWVKAGKSVRAHAGERPQYADNVRKAILIGVTDIAHGIYSTPDDLKEATKRGIRFDLALHSNLMTGAIDDISKHPMARMLDTGCWMTLGTDDPIQFGCTLDDEFNLALKHNLLDLRGSQELKLIASQKGK